MSLKTILATVVFVGTALSAAPAVMAHDTGAAHGGAAPAPYPYYPPYPMYRDSGSDFFDDGSFFGDTRGSGRGSGSGEGEFNMNMSGKGRGRSDMDSSFDGSGYGGTSNYPGYGGYGGGYGPGYGGPRYAPQRAPAPAPRQ